MGITIWCTSSNLAWTVRGLNIQLPEWGLRCLCTEPVYIYADGVIVLDSSVLRSLRVPHGSSFTMLRQLAQSSQHQLALPEIVLDEYLSGLPPRRPRGLPR